MKFESIQAAVDAQAVAFAESIFLSSTDGRQSVSFAELPHKATLTGERLAGMGLQTGDRVAVLLDNGVFTAELLISLLYCGFVAVPLNPNSGPDQLRRVLQHSDAKLLISSPDVSLADLNLANELQVLRADPDLGLTETQNNHLNPQRQASLSTPSGSHEAFLIYTSGTTGRPKGVVFYKFKLF
jgi:long-chain acyl-CoA synthetase